MSGRSAHPWPWRGRRSIGQQAAEASIGALTEALCQTLTELGGSVGATTDRAIELTLTSKAALTFACVRLTFDAAGTILVIPLDHTTRTLSNLAPAQVRLSPRPGLLLRND